MGNKKNRGRNRKKQQKKKQQDNKPFVSICTPTFNRRPFILHTIKCYLHQDYPRDKLEWIIIDDGTDLIEDLVKDISGVKYFKYSEKMTLGKKRNLMHAKSKGDIIVYMDDDDYYPPERVSHAVDMLTRNKQALCAGASEIYIWFKHIQKMYQFGPYGPKHATAGTFAFKRELLLQTSYEESASLAEEKHFLKNYTIPFVQLDPIKTILVFSHEHNTFDKRTLLNNQHPKYVKESSKTVDTFIKQPDMKEFYMEQISELLTDYEPGKPKYKPDVIKQTKEITERRQKLQADANAKQNGNIVLQQPDGKNVTLNNVQIVQLLKQLQEKVKQTTALVNKLTQKDEENKKIIQQLQDQINTLTNEKTKLSENQTNTPINNNPIILQQSDGTKIPLTNVQIVQLLKQQQSKINTQNETITQLRSSYDDTISVDVISPSSQSSYASQNQSNMVSPPIPPPIGSNNVPLIIDNSCNTNHPNHIIL